MSETAHTVVNLDSDLLAALRGRGFTDAEIAVMSPEKMFDQYCGWELGDPYWGITLRRILDNARAAISKAQKGDTP